MICASTRRFAMLFYRSCIVLLLLVVGCSGTATPVRVTETLLLPTLPPSPTPCPTPPSCYENRDFPPICGIIPGQSTFEQVERIMGSPMPTATVDVDLGVSLPAGVDVDTRGFPCGCPLTLYFADNVASEVNYIFKQDKYLWQVVDMYGPPDKVQAIWFYPELEGSGGYYVVAFIWPARGLLMEAELPEAIEQPLEAPPFQAGLRIPVVHYFQPTDLEDIVSTYYDGEVLIDWPGMTE
jgi:hypothetical protein